MIPRSYASSRFGLVRASSITAALCVLVLADGLATAALAQGTPDSRVAVSVTGGYRTNVTTFSQTVTFEQYSENGSLTSTYSIRRRPFIEAGVSVRVWRNLGVGVSGSYFTDRGSAQVSALVPNPLVFNQPRQLSGAAGVAHTETAAHVEALYWAQPTPRLDVMVSGGPSVFWVDQAFVSDVTYTQTFPYDTATYQDASTVSMRKRVTGFNVGGQVGVRFVWHLALVGTVRFSRATADFAGTSAQTVRVGGVHVGGGVRLLF